MKKLVILLLAGSSVLSGCVGYAVPYGNETVYDSNRGANRGDRDRDRDGVPNRMDRDRDNDGVPNRNDSRPNNPNRY